MALYVREKNSVTRGMEIKKILTQTKSPILPHPLKSQIPGPLSELIT